MSRVMVWKSDADGKLFEDKAKYMAHLRKLGRERLRIRKAKQAELMREAFITRMGQEVTGPESLEQFIKDNWDWFFSNGYRNGWRAQSNKVHEYVEVSFENLYWSDNLSNSHSCPRNGVTNWGSRDTYPDGTAKPRGYPGWGGRINIRVRTPMVTKTRQADGFGSDYFKYTPINTGTGGGGGVKDGVTKYSYDVKLWADDFPTWAREREKELVWKYLTEDEKEYDPW